MSARRATSTTHPLYLDDRTRLEALVGLACGHSVTAVARFHGVSRKSVLNWVRTYGLPGGAHLVDGRAAPARRRGSPSRTIAAS